MNLCRFRKTAGDDAIRVGLLANPSELFDLTDAGVAALEPALESADPAARLRALIERRPPRLALSQVRLCAPVEQQEVWAAGVTYPRTKWREWRNPISARPPTTAFTPPSALKLSSNPLAAKVVADGGAGRHSRPTPAGACRSRNWRWCSIPGASLPPAPSATT